MTSDLIARLYRHRNDLIPGFTSRYGVHRLIWFEQHPGMTSAIRREKQLKTWNRDWTLNLIEAENPEWADLAIGLGFAPAAARPNGFPPPRG